MLTEFIKLRRRGFFDFKPGFFGKTFPVIIRSAENGKKKNVELSTVIDVETEVMNEQMSDNPDFDYDNAPTNTCRRTSCNR